MIFLTSLDGMVLVNGEEVESIYTVPSWNYSTLGVALKTKEEKSIIWDLILTRCELKR